MTKRSVSNARNLGSGRTAVLQVDTLLSAEWTANLDCTTEEPSVAVGACCTHLDENPDVMKEEKNKNNYEYKYFHTVYRIVEPNVQ